MSAAAGDLLAEEYLRRLAGLGDHLRIELDVALSLSQGVVRTLNIYEPDAQATKRKTWQLVVSNLSIAGADQSTAALLRALADLLEQVRGQEPTKATVRSERYRRRHQSRRPKKPLS